MKYDLVLFDFDGTLADSFPWFLSIMGDVADRFGFRRIDRSEFEAVRGLDARAFLRHVGLPLWKVPLVARHVRRLQSQQIDRIKPFPGVRDLFKRLAERHVTIAMVTSNGEANVRRVLGPSNEALVSYFACNASLLGKARRIRGVLRDSGLSADRTILIGDEARDIDAARAAGVASGAVAWGYADVESLRARGPTEVFMTMEEMAERLAPR
jgi:phosphoglycolate phosphatase